MIWVITAFWFNYILVRIVMFGLQWLSDHPLPLLLFDFLSWVINLSFRFFTLRVFVQLLFICWLVVCLLLIIAFILIIYVFLIVCLHILYQKRKRHADLTIASWINHRIFTCMLIFLPHHIAIVSFLLCIFIELIDLSLLFLFDVLSTPQVDLAAEWSAGDNW